MDPDFRDDGIGIVYVKWSKNWIIKWRTNLIVAFLMIK
jgi:ABC-type ATPase with predicted acetyltransferase domain